MSLGNLNFFNLNSDFTSALKEQKTRLGWSANILCLLPNKGHKATDSKINPASLPSVFGETGNQSTSSKERRGAGPWRHRRGTAGVNPIQQRFSRLQREPAEEGRSVKSSTPGGFFCTRVCSWCQEPTAKRPAVPPPRLHRFTLRLHGSALTCCRSSRLHLRHWASSCPPASWYGAFVWFHSANDPSSIILTRFWIVQCPTRVWLFSEAKT